MSWYESRAILETLQDLFGPQLPKVTLPGLPKPSEIVTREGDPIDFNELDRIIEKYQDNDL